MKTPHKHAAVIKAWADGEAIEFWDGYRWSLITHPIWNGNHKYRVKPELVAHRVAAGLVDGILQVTLDRSNENLKLTFEDGKLIKAEVLPEVGKL